MPFDSHVPRWRRFVLPALALLALPGGVQAATLTVTSTGDNINDPTTLRGAIAASEQSADASDTINITATGTIPIGANGELGVYSGSNVPGKTLTINGPGAANLSIDGGGQTRVFDVFEGLNGPITLNMSGVTISGGATNAGGAGMIVFPGETVNLSGVTFTGNAVVDHNGGALYEFNATVMLDGCTVDGNTAFEGPDEDTTQGGGLYLDGGSVTLTNSTVSNNQSDDYAGGIENRGGTLTITGSTISGNTTGINSGGIQNDGTATVTNTLISNNTGSYGGGVYSDGTLTVDGCVFIGNTAPGTSFGGGLFSQISAGGGLTVTNSAFQNNTAGAGGGLFSFVNGVPSGSSVLSTISGCTFNGNTAQEGGAVYSYIAASGTGSGSISTAFTNCTFTGNVAQSDLGGGLYVESEDTASGAAPLDTSLTNCTISGNSAPNGGGGLDIYGGTSPNNASPITPTCTLTSTIIAGNTLTGLSAGATQDVNLESHADLKTGGSNLVGVADSSGVLIDGANHDQIGTTVSPLDPRLGPLADHGGPTQTLALLGGSPALDADFNTAVSVDQRGSLRPAGVRNDIGAFEHQAPTAVAHAYTTGAGMALTVPAPGVLANDTATDAVSAVTATLATGPNHGVLILNADGSFTYTPTAGFAGTDTFTYQVSDGSTVSVPATVTLTVQDVTAPVTTAILNPGQPNGHNGYYTGPVQVTLSASDDASGVASTTYALDGGAAQTYSAPFTVASDGHHTITFFSTDAAGNVESPVKSVSFALDATTPVTTATSHATPTGSTVTLTAADALSGVAATTYSLGGGAQTPYSAPIAVKGNGTHTVTYFSTDKAGNTEATKHLSITIDIAAPVTTATVSGPQDSHGNYTGSVKVALAATSAASTVVSTTYSVDGGVPTIYNSPFTVAAAGSHTVTYFSTDAAGNAETAKSVSFKIQLIPAVAHTFPAGLQLFSVPADYSAVPLGTALSQINPKLAVWDPAALQYALSPSAPADALRPGQGYWARFGQTTSLYDLGTPTPTAQPFSISLKKGWNMIGDPFPATISLGSVQVQSAGKTYGSLDLANKAGVVAFTLYSYPAGATAYSTETGAGSLVPYTGYWLYAFADSALEISAP